MQYFVLPTCCIAFNAKVGSSSLACAIVNKHYPDKLQKALYEYDETWSKFSPEFKNALPESFQKMFRNDKLDSVSFWQNICTRTNKPDLPVLLAVREPIARFISTVAYLKLDVEKTLKVLENDEETVIEKSLIRLRKNTHFLTQSCLVTNNTQLYRFPDQLEKLCFDAGLEYPLPFVNEGKHKKPTLTDDQITRVSNFYADDVILYNSIV
jgi:hypothetical protein